MKTLKDIQSMAVIGAGTMGAGIAQVAAMSGLRVILYDLSAAILDQAKARIEKNLSGAVARAKISEEQKTSALKQITATSEFADLKADIVIEAILEDLALKVDAFQRVAAMNADETILASNTSSIPITRIARDIPRPERVVGMHFFNPVHIMKLVEVISGAATDPAVVDVTRQLAEKMGKKAVLAKDAPGFIVNRVARHFYVESLKVLEEQVADHATIDALMEASGFRMGPFRLMDLIGIDTNYSVTASMHQSFHYAAKFRPSRIQQQKVDAGHIGRKSGKGFYDYPET